MDYINKEELVIRPKRLKGSDGFKTFSIRIKQELVDRIDEISSSTDRSRNELIGMLLEYALAHCKIENNDS